VGHEELDGVTGTVVDSGIKVHTVLGPGLLETPYRRCLAYELRKRGLRVEEEVPLPLTYDGLRIDAAYRIDLLVNDCVIVEVKSSVQLLPVHSAQLLTYLRLTGAPVGLLMNFYVARLRDGIKLS
jgi:GxxExxY protein